MESTSRRSVLSLLSSGLAVLAAAGSARAEAQPHMRDALEALQRAERALEAADRDKGGHRERALELTRKAISQVERGLRFDNRH
jgi:hypothetical protein